MFPGHKEAKGFAHLTTLHGKLGAITTAAYVCQRCRDINIYCQPRKGTNFLICHLQNKLKIYNLHNNSVPLFGKTDPGSILSFRWTGLSLVGGVAWWFPSLLGKYRSAAFVLHGIGGYFGALYLIGVHSLALAASYNVRLECVFYIKWCTSGSRLSSLTLRISCLCGDAFKYFHWICM